MKKKIVIIVLVICLIISLFLFVFSPIESIKDVNTSPEISILGDDDEEIIHLINSHKTTPIELSKMSNKNIAILLDIEDNSFYKHSGFNLSRIFKTIVSNFNKNQAHGASTITQQYIKNVYLNNKKTFSRKIKELYYAIKLEQIASKDEILSGYLNCVYFGNDIYGIANASKYYFDVEYSDLTVSQMTTLVAMLNAPTYYSNNKEDLEKRKNLYLSKLLKDGIIDVKEYDSASNQIEYKYNKNIYNSNLLYFTDGVLKEYNAINHHPKFNQVVTIKTKYSSKMNKITYNSTANYAAIAVDKEGFILSMIGDKDYSSSTFNIVTNGKRDIGSTIKPILYYEALRCGFSPKTIFYSGPYSFSYHDEMITISNYGSIYPYKNITMAEALATSDNIYAIKMHQTIGFKTLANHFKNYNIEAQSIPSLALGSVGMSLYDLVRIYSQFFTEGKYLTFKYIKSIYIDEKPFYEAKNKYKILGSAEYFKSIRNIMDGLFDSSIPHATASSIAPFIKSKCYGKSGLTDYDSYMIGFNEDILVGVWAGYLDNSLLNDSKTKKLPKELFVTLINAN